MSQELPPDDPPFIPPPPPPSVAGDPIYPEDVLRAKTDLVNSEVKTALILSIIGLVCCGFILGIIAFRKANDSLETMRIYGVAPEKRGLAKAAKVLSVLDIVGSVVAVIARFAMS